MTIKARTRSLIILLLLVVCSWSSIRTSSSTDISKNQIYTLGSLHGHMLTHPYLSLREFVRAIDLYHPDLILTEVRSDHPGPIEGSLDGGIEQSIVYAYASLNKVEVVSVDWFDDEWLTKSFAFNAKPNPSLDEKLKPFEEKYLKILELGNFITIQGKDTKNLVEQMYAVGEENGEFLSKIRNEHILKNINKSLAGTHGRRIMIVFGLDHKYYLDRSLASEGNKVLDITDWYVEPNGTEYQISKELKNSAIQNMTESQTLLRKRLESGYYSGENKARFEKKLSSFDTWISKMRTM